ncbi:lantibiotic dehydratase [Chitinophaga flava]|uniref:Lantibiotic dehydratase n=1 Tax=Chitinophaga flava TaxID=2259036 RepID=A0A365XYJ6_9BACT|nr:lantibiotic dehydratase [Chitinophaga flava]RBL91138.1 hypothetical protein DF182_00510 [Chitinophaga flava]
MKDEKRDQPGISGADFYLLRTPLLPVAHLFRLNKTIAEDKTRLEALLKEIYTDTLLQEAIYISSPVLYDEMMKWLGGASRSKKDLDKLLNSLYKYYCRMCTRSTPYGLFAGCSTGEVSDKSDLKLEEGSYRMNARLDMNYVSELAAVIAALPEVKRQIKYYPNNSIYKMGDQLRYIEYKTVDKYRTFRISSVQYAEYLQLVMDTCRDGATLDAIANKLQTDDISSEEAEEFVESLLESQLLVSELEPAVTGDFFFHVLIEKLERLNDTTTIVAQLKKVNSLLEGEKRGVDKYKEIQTLLSVFIPGSSEKDLVQIDLYHQSVSNRLHSSLVQDLCRDTALLYAALGMAGNVFLDTFRKDFANRYEEQEIPLTEVLDPESGIGYGTFRNGSVEFAPLVKGIGNAAERGNSNSSFTAFDKFLLNKYLEAISCGAKEIILLEEELRSVTGRGSENIIPVSFHLHGSLLADSAAAIDEGRYRFCLRSASGPSSAILLGRFAHGDQKLCDGLKECLRDEEKWYPDAILAEIVHLPQARVGNVLMRPALRDFEIPYLCQPGVERDRQITIDDLMVSVVKGEVVLRSKRLNKRVIPRMSTAHNFNNGTLVVYKFLCDLQTQHVAGGFRWNWGVLDDRDFLPAVRYRQIILSRARWRITRKELQQFNEQGEWQHIQQLRKARNLPQQVLLVDYDNELLIDLDTHIGAGILYKELQKKGSVVLLEFLGQPHETIVEGTSGTYLNEVVFPLHRNMDNIISAPVGIKHTASNIQRNFVPGSPWLYVKIYCGMRHAETILTDVIAPYVSSLLEGKCITGFFFIRYVDTDFHLRLRFYNDQKDGFWESILKDLQALLHPYVEEHIVYRIQTDTYKRELERYGETTIIHAESFFQFDSIAALQLISILHGDEGERFRWLVVIKSVHQLLEDFGLTLSGKRAIMEKLSTAFMQEFGNSDALEIHLNEIYRKENSYIRKVMAGQDDQHEDIWRDVTNIIEKRSRALQSVVAELKQQLQQYDSIETQLRSYIHMLINRMMISSPRKHELVIYTLMKKYYISIESIMKQAKVIQ